MILAHSSLSLTFSHPSGTLSAHFLVLNLSIPFIFSCCFLIPILSPLIWWLHPHYDVYLVHLVILPFVDNLTHFCQSICGAIYLALLQSHKKRLTGYLDGSSLLLVFPTWSSGCLAPSSPHPHFNFWQQQQIFHFNFWVVSNLFMFIYSLFLEEVSFSPAHCRVLNNLKDINSFILIIIFLSGFDNICLVTVNLLSNLSMIWEFRSLMSDHYCKLRRAPIVLGIVLVPLPWVWFAQEGNCFAECTLLCCSLALI